MKISHIVGLDFVKTIKATANKMRYATKLAAVNKETATPKVVVSSVKAVKSVKTVKSVKKSTSSVSPCRPGKVAGEMTTQRRAAIRAHARAVVAAWKQLPVVNGWLESKVSYLIDTLLSSKTNAIQEVTKQTGRKVSETVDRNGLRFI